MKRFHLVAIAIISFLYSSRVLAQEISWLPDVNKSSLPVASNINKLLAQLKGKMRPLVCEYNGSKLSQKFSFETANLKIGEQEWKCAITQVPVVSTKDAVDLNVVFKLMKGKMTSAGVAIAFDFNDWNTDNYVMIPASVYNGNRNKIEQRGYCTGFEKFRRYLLGLDDGVEKNTDWAAAITGVPAETIRSLADRAATAPTMITCAWSLQRAHHGEQPYWAAIVLAAMLGGIGLPGTGFSFGHGSTNGIGVPPFLAIT
jgi:hypothetical protein